MKIEKIYLDWESVDRFQSDGENECIMLLKDGSQIRVKYSFEELLNIRNSFSLDSKVVLDLIDE